MSDVETTCPHCNTMFSVDEAYVGQNLPCPNCGNSFLIQGIPQPVQIAQPMYQQPPMPVQQPMYQQPYAQPASQPKERMIFILLGVFLGGLGAHNFYAGYTAKGAIQLLISLLSGGMASIFVWIWVIIEICTVQTDAQGVPFK